MISKEGYLSPSEVTFALLHHAHENGTDVKGLPVGELQNFAHTVFWKFSDSLEYVHVLTPTGEVLLGDKSLLRHRDKTLDNGLFFSIRFGFLGVLRPTTPVAPRRFFRRLLWAIKYSRRRETARRNRIFLQNTLGPFFGMAIIFDQRQVDQYLAPPEPLNQLDLNTERNVTSAILEAYQNGNITTKSDARRIIGASLPTRAFDRAWAKAAEQQPLLSKPGRRSLFED